LTAREQTGLVDLLLQNDVPFSVQPTPESGGPLAAFGGIGSLLLPLSLLAFFILPRLRNGGKTICGRSCFGEGCVGWSVFEVLSERVCATHWSCATASKMCRMIGWCKT